MDSSNISIAHNSMRCRLVYLTELRQDMEGYGKVNSQQPSEIKSTIGDTNDEFQNKI
jgi:hypothetical protein